MTTHCPQCGYPYSLVGRAHRCVPKQISVGREGSLAGSLAIGANQVSMGVTPPSRAEQAPLTANRNEPANNSHIIDPVTGKRKWPYRNRAEYMRAYRQKAKQAVSA